MPAWPSHIAHGLIAHGPHTPNAPHPQYQSSDPNHNPNPYCIALNSPGLCPPSLRLNSIVIILPPTPRCYHGSNTTLPPPTHHHHSPSPHDTARPHPMASHSSAPAPPDPPSMHTTLAPNPIPPHPQVCQTLQLAQARRYGPCELVSAEQSASTSTHSAVAHRQPQHPQPCTQPSLHIHTPSTPPHVHMHAATTGEGGKEPPPHPALSSPLHSLPPPASASIASC